MGRPSLHAALHRPLLSVACAIALAGVCTNTRAEPPKESQEGFARFRAPGGSQAQREALLPDSAAAEKLRLILEVVNGGKLGDASEHFAPEFLEYISEEEIASELASVGKAFEGERVMPVEVTASPDRPDTITSVVSSRRGKMFLTMFLLINEDTGLITALRIDPAGNPSGGGGDGGQAPASWGDFGGELDDLPGEIGFGAWALVAAADGTQELLPVAAQNENNTLAIGSSFKLWVLGALAEDVLSEAKQAAADDAKSKEQGADGDAAKGLTPKEPAPAEAATSRLNWATSLTVQNKLKSLPSGTLQLKKEGDRISLADAATQMISISDNTAADHLLHMLGRERIESFMRGVNSTPERNMPLLSTREAFVLKLSSDDGLLERFLAQDEEGKRELLRDVLVDIEPDREAAAEWAEPRLVESVEWFASAHDCARTLARLRELEIAGAAFDKNNTLGKVLRKNPGLSLDPAIWKSAAFKGGSEPGVLHGCWMLERADGKWYVFSLAWNNKDELVNQDRFLELAYQGMDLLAKDGVAEGEALPKLEDPNAGKKPERDPKRPREEGKPVDPLPKPAVRPT
jgi:hypothetical protein